MKKLAIAIQKGGVGKTATAVQVAVAWARAGWRVLLIDLDSQGDATDKLAQGETGKRGAIDVILQRAPLLDVVRSTEWGVDLCPASEELSNAEAAIVNEMGRERILADALDEVPAAKRWDVCVIDCPPALGLLTVNALTAADAVLAPVRAAREPLRGLNRYVSMIEKVRKKLNPNLEPLGILLCAADEREGVTEETRGMLRKKFGDAFWRLEVRADSSMKSASLSMRSKAVRDYELVADELGKRLGLSRRQSLLTAKNTPRLGASSATSKPL